MKKRTKIAILISVTLILIGIIAIVGASAAIGFDFRRLDTESYKADRQQIDDVFNSINIDANICDISLIPSNDGVCRIEYQTDEDTDFSFKVENGTLTVTESREPVIKFSISFKETYIRLYLPESQYSSLSINTDTSDVAIPSSFSFETAKILTDTGEVEYYAAVKNRLSIETDTGDVDISKISTDGEITIKTDTGDIEADGVNCADFTAESDTGEISFDNVISKNTIEIKSNTGDVELDRCDASSLLIETDTGDVEGELLTEKVFITETDTGHIRVPKTSSGGRCEIITNTGDIEFE